jgi:hypothetical protein
MHDDAANVVTEGSQLQAEARVGRVGQITLYQVRTTPAIPSARPAHVDLEVFDQDEIPAKQRLRYAPLNAVGIEGWHRLIWKE